MSFREIQPFRRSHRAGRRSSEAIASAGIRTFSGFDLESPDRIARHLNRGGTALPEGSCERILRLQDWLRTRVAQPDGLDRLVIRVQGEAAQQVIPVQRVPNLELLTGSVARGFLPVGANRFDLVIFNAPWVVAPVRSREEWSLHDPNQRTIERFLAEVRDHLNPGGRVLIGYADHSGPRGHEQSRSHDRCLRSGRRQLRVGPDQNRSEPRGVAVDLRHYARRAKPVTAASPVCYHMGYRSHG